MMKLIAAFRNFANVPKNDGRKEKNVRQTGINSYNV